MGEARGKNVKKKKARDKNDEEERKKKEKIIKIREAYRSQCNYLDWTFHNEREFIGTIFQNRFNYLLVVFSLFTTAYFTVANDIINRLVVLFIGIIINSLLWITLYRTYVRYQILTEIANCINENSAHYIVQKMLTEKIITKLYTPHKMIGVIIPFVMITLFFVGIVINLLYLFNIDKNEIDNIIKVYIKIIDGIKVYINK